MRQVAVLVEGRMEECLVEDIIGSLWNADPEEKPMGTSTVGSSEACMLGGLAMLFRWKKLADTG